MRLIDADELKKAIEDYLERNQEVMIYDVDMLDMLDNAPTVEERLTGEWKYNQYDANGNIGNWHCSECRHIVYGGRSQKPYYNYCPNCGAKMEES